ncbi:MAG: N-acetylmuramoyl-L-alanine amidase [Lachnospiraceae bacterium]|nr:N-acetylmuramoyl-L-alanine amidase [Lachnospiraceae bacterium]
MKYVLFKRKYSYHAIAAIVFTVAMLAWMFFFRESLAVSRARYKQMTGLERLEYNNANIEETDEKLADHIRVPLPGNYREADVSTYVEPVSRIITIYIPKVTENFIYDNPIMGCETGITGLEAGPSDLGMRLQIRTEVLQEPVLTFEDRYMYISFKDPKEVYDKIVVVDAGHGGDDPGMSAQDTREADLNLTIAKYLQDLLEDKGIKVYMTRTEDVSTSLEQRVDLANSLEADAFISVHCNAQKDDEDTLMGTQVFYNAEDTSGASLRLAELCMDSVTSAFESNRLLCSKGNDIYIIRESKIPVALVEVGFMTNEAEMAKLLSPEYQRNAALGIADGVLKAYDRGIIHND